MKRKRSSVRIIRGNRSSVTIRPRLQENEAQRLVYHPSTVEDRVSRGQRQRAVRLDQSPWWEEPNDRVICTNSKIRLFWWHDFKLRGANFGDALSPLIVEKLSGRRVVRVDSSPKLLAIGSVAKFAKRGDHLWGTGFPMDGQTCEQVVVSAVRGPRTRTRLLQLGMKCPQVYGDPALLAPFFFKNSEKSQREVLIVPHYTDFKRAQQLAQGKGLKIVNLLDSVKSILRKISSAKLVYSSSLHGVIVAEAYGVPAVWVEFSDNVRGAGWKFRDYYESTGRACEPLNWRQQISFKGEPPEILLPDLEQLYEAFPFRASSLDAVPLSELTGEEL